MTEQSDALGDLVQLAADVLGHDGRVPRRLPTQDMPERASAVQQVIGASARLLVLRFVLSNAGCTRAEISESTSITYSAIKEALAELEHLGYVEVTPPGPRQGRTMHYTANRATLTDDLSQLFAWLLR